VTRLFLKVVSQPIQLEKHNWGINCVASGWGHEMLNKISKFWPCSIKKIGHANFEYVYKFSWKWKDAWSFKVALVGFVNLLHLMLDVL
jgi:hypothetical protein